MGDWDTPPTEAEIKAAANDPWAAPPTEAELLGAGGKKMSRAESAMHGWTQGATLGTGDEAGALLQAYLMRVAKSAPKWAADRLVGGDFRAEEADAGQTYRAARDQNRAINEKARADNPEVYTGTEIVGGIMAPVPGGSVSSGAKLGSRLLQAAGKGALFGGVYGAGASEADLLDGEVGKFALDTGVSGVLGGAGGALGQGVMEAGGALRRGLQSKATKNVAKAESKIKDLAQEKVLKDRASLSGELGDSAAREYRTAEKLLFLEERGLLDATQKAELEALRASGELGKSLKKLGDSGLRDFRKVAAEREARESVLAGHRASEEELLEAAQREIGNPMNQVTPWLKTYAAPAAGILGGGGAGFTAGLLSGADPTEIGALTLAGAGARPAIRASLKRLRHPSMQRSLWSSIEGVAKGSAALAPAGARGARAASVPQPWAPDLPSFAGLEEDELKKQKATAEALRKRKKSSKADGDLAMKVTDDDGNVLYDDNR